MLTRFYARVSSGRQENEETIQSQVAELCAKMVGDGIGAPEGFTDEGYSRNNLARPGLDRLRDMALLGDLERLYILCPDRLASGAKLIFLVEEFQKSGVEVIFLMGAVEDTPEGMLLLHMQGAIAEYERTKIVERTRRGKMYWSKQGALMGGFVPYGYRYVPRDRENNQRATLEIDEVEAAVVRDMFRWLIEEQMSCRGIAKRLTDLGIITRTGKTRWTPGVVNKMLKQGAYKGTFYYHRTEPVEPSSRRDKATYPKYKLTGKRLRPREEWIEIPVPAVVDVATWDRAQRQLQLNSLHSPRNNTRRTYLLRGLIRCPRCGSTFVGAFSHGRRNYHCNRFDPIASSTGERCHAPQVRAEAVEDAVWAAISDALQRPDTLVEEYRRQVAQADAPDVKEVERKQLETALKRLKSQQDRITDAYINEAMELPQYKSQMDKIREGRQLIEQSLAEVEKRKRLWDMERQALTRLEAFRETVSQGLENLTFEERQSLLRLIVEKIVVDEGKVRVEAIIPLDEASGDLVRLRPPCLHPGSG